MLATYNGERFIIEQLNSLRNQTYKNFDLIISDDGSTDATMEIVESFAKKYSDIKIIQNETGRHGALYNFSNLVHYVKTRQLNYDYYMFCDQDDIWLPQKVEWSLQEIKKYNLLIPQLVYTSKQYVDEELQLLSFNLKNEDKININIIHQSMSYGCTHCINKALLNLLDDNNHDYYHYYDYYVNVQAYLFGEIHFLNKKTILYRQHNKNASGTVRKSFLQKLNLKGKYKHDIQKLLKMVDCFYEQRYLLSINDSKKIVCLYKYINHLFFTAIVCGLKKNTFVGTIQFYLALLLYRFW